MNRASSYSVPNPSADNLFLIFDNDSIATIFAQIYSSDGNLVLQSDEQENAALKWMFPDWLPAFITVCYMEMIKK